MSSETINELVGSLTHLQDKLQKLDGETRRLGELRGDLKSVASSLTATGKELQAVAASMADGAATMRTLDMAATLKRLAEIEKALDTRSRELEKAIEREIVQLAESLKLQVSTQLDALPGQIGPTVANAFDKQFATTKSAIDSLVTDAGARHQSLGASLQSGVDKLLADMSDRSTVASQALSRLQSSVLEASSTQLASMMKALAEAETRNIAQSKALEGALLAGTSKARLMATLAFVVATLGAIASVVSLFV